MFVLFAPSFVDYMCTLRNRELYPLRNMKALCNYFGGEECLWLCRTTLEMCVLKDVRENGMVVKESHRTSLVGSPN